MVRFRCIHCDANIAVHDRFMDRLACCPECGGMTHPLAEHLVQSGEISSTANVTQSSATSANTPVLAPASELRCANCDAAIGKLQTPFEWQGHPVCAPCHRLLSMEKGGTAGNKTTPTTREIPLLDEPAQPITVVAVRSPAAENSSADFSVSGDSSQQAKAHSIDSPVQLVARRKGSEIEQPRLLDRIGEFAWLMRGKIVAFFGVALALYLVISIIKSLGVVLLWAAAIVVIVPVAWQIRRGWFALRRKVGSGGSLGALKKIASMVRR